MTESGHPRRIQLSRKKGWRLPPNTVVVSKPTRWGNPFKVTPDRSRRLAVGAFETWLRVEGCTASIPERKEWILEHVRELKGKNLACFCPLDEPCHADVLLKIANA